MQWNGHKFDGRDCKNDLNSGSEFAWWRRSLQAEGMACQKVRRQKRHGRI